MSSVVTSEVVNMGVVCKNAITVCYVDRFIQKRITTHTRSAWELSRAGMIHE